MKLNGVKKISYVLTVQIDSPPDPLSIRLIKGNSNNFKQIERGRKRAIKFVYAS
jgi:hypothetical protein